MVRGRKKRRNSKKLTNRNAAVAIHVMRRRIWFTGSAAPSTALFLAPYEVPTGLAAALGLSADAGALGAGGVAFSAVTFCFSSPSTFWFASCAVSMLEVSKNPSIIRETIRTTSFNEDARRAPPTYTV